jgi:hypothetical protein
MLFQFSLICYDIRYILSGVLVSFFAAAAAAAIHRFRRNDIF